MDPTPEATLSESTDWKLFEEIAARLQDELEGQWVERLDGIAERYWDLRVKDEVLTLHLQDELGISIFPASEGENFRLYDRACRLFGV